MQCHIFAILVTWNGMKWIRKCIECLLASSIPLDVVLVDNASTDGTLDYVKDNYPNITVIPLSSNLGFGKANNIGISEALKQGADYVFLINQDAYIEENTIKNALAATSNQDNVGLISCLQLNGDGSGIDEFFKICVDYSQTSGFLNDLILGNEIKPFYTSEIGFAAAWLIPKNTLKRIGGFNPVFHHYGEDEDYCNRVLFKGLRILFIPSSRVFHDRITQGNVRIFENNRIFRSCLIDYMNVTHPKFFFTKRNRVRIIESLLQLFCLNITPLWQTIKFYCFILAHYSYLKGVIGSSN